MPHTLPIHTLLSNLWFHNRFILSLTIFSLLYFLYATARVPTHPLEDRPISSGHLNILCLVVGIMGGSVYGASKILAAKGVLSMTGMKMTEGNIVGGDDGAREEWDRGWSF